MDVRYEPGDNKILHDEYFGKKPSVVFLLTVRLVLLCVMSCSFIMLFCDLYGFSGNRWIPALISVGVSFATYILASLFPAGIVYGAELIGVSLAVFLMRDKLIEKAQFFWDLIMLKIDSRLLDPTGMFFHNEEKIRNGYYPFEVAMNDAYASAAILLAIVSAILFTAAVRTRPHLSVPVLLATLIITPAVAAETAGFMPSLIVFIICIFGFEAVNTSYELDNGFIYGSLSSAHYNQRHADSYFRKHTRFTILAKKSDLDTTHYHRYSSNLIAMSIVTAFVFFGAARIIPDGTGLNFEKVFNALEDFGYKIADTFGSVFGTTFGEAEDKGYFSEDTFGDLSSDISIAPPNSSDRPVLEVTLSRKDIPVYLRGDIGVNYVDGKWTSIATIDEEYKEAVAPDFYPETEYQVFRLALAAQGILPDKWLPLQMVSTRYLRNTRVVFQPVAAYELTYRTNPKYVDLGDYILRTKDSFVKSYECLSLTPTITMPDFSTGGMSSTDAGLSLVWMSWDMPDELVYKHSIPAANMNNEKYLSQIDKYRDFIYREYSRSDPVIIGLIESLKPYKDKRLIDDTIRIAGTMIENISAYILSTAICDYFKDNYTYSLDVDNGEDQLKGFLYDTHRGHCALFATAMTLALRDAGFPARYVTGYVAEGISKEVKDGYKFTLTERQLHAWVEVYFQGIGWLPFDPTAAVPGYAEVTEGKWDGKGEFEKPDPSKTDVTSATTSGTSETKPPETSATSGTNTEKTTDSTEDTTSPADSGTDSSGGNNNNHKEPGFLELLLTRYLYIVIIVAVIIVVAIILIIFVNKLNNSEKRVLRSFRGLPPYEACSVMYRFILTLLKNKGLEPGNEQFYDFAERVDSTTLLKDTNVFMMDIMPVFEKCEFGNKSVSPVTDDEKEVVYRFTMELYRKIMGDFSPVKRFFVKISLFL